jgi:ribosomal protein S18 acetylase RimI-like enzyme
LDDIALERLEPTERWLDSLAEHGGEVITVGPFLALMHPSPDALGFNYAAPVVPWDPDRDVTDALRALRHVFIERSLVPRLEFNEPLFPGLASELTRHGFVVEVDEPVMLCTPSDFRPLFKPEVSVRYLQPTDDDSELIAYQTIFTEVLLDRPWQPSPEAVADFRKQVEGAKQGGHALAHLDGRPVGTGFISWLDGVSEITRVATIPAARRRGVAATLTSFMMQDRFRSGDTLVWLTAANASAQALYLKLGFRLVGSRLCWRFAGA